MVVGKHSFEVSWKFSGTEKYVKKKTKNKEISSMLHFSNMKLNVASFCEFDRLFFGSASKVRHVAKAIAKTPQSLELVCCWTGTKLIAFKLPASVISQVLLPPDL